MLVVALTGGIGSGKSTACELFKALGTPVIDADVIAHQLVQPEQPALNEITQHFGKALLTADGQLDRAKLRQMIFSDQAKKAQLEAILHPRIRQEMNRQIAALSSSYCIVAIPLLVETGQTGFADRILVIDLPETEQRKRACQRDQQSEREIEAIISTQASRGERLAIADDIIHNDGDLEELNQQVSALHQQYHSVRKAI